MNCPQCHGKGRTVGKTMFGQGHDHPLELTEIGPCPDCYGTGSLNCCEGDRAQALLNVADRALEQAGKILRNNTDTDVNPNGC
jgi:hypothetical protein